MPLMISSYGYNLNKQRNLRTVCVHLSRNDTYTRNRKVLFSVAFGAHIPRGKHLRLIIGTLLGTKKIANGRSQADMLSTFFARNIFAKRGAN